MDVLIYKQDAIDALGERPLAWTESEYETGLQNQWEVDMDAIKAVPPASPEDYTELKREFILMASYIDVLLECSDEQRETLVGFISRLAEFMPWTERD